MKYKATIVVGVVEGNTIEEARKIIYEKLEYFAGSNDGSELLANAVVTLEETEPTAEWSRFGGFKLK